MIQFDQYFSDGLVQPPTSYSIRWFETFVSDLRQVDASWWVFFQFNWGLKPSIGVWSHTPPKTSMTGCKIYHLKMDFLLNMGIFQLVMLVFRGVYVFLFKNYHPLPHGQHWTPCSALDETRHCSREFSLKPQFFGYLKREIIWFGKGI